MQTLFQSSKLHQLATISLQVAHLSTCLINFQQSLKTALPWSVCSPMQTLLLGCFRTSSLRTLLRFVKPPQALRKKQMPSPAPQLQPPVRSTVRLQTAKNMRYKPWASEGVAGGKDPLDFEISSKKGCFLSFKREKNKFYHFWPTPGKIVEKCPSSSPGKNPSDAHVTNPSKHLQLQWAFSRLTTNMANKTQAWKTYDRKQTFIFLPRSAQPAERKYNYSSSNANDDVSRVVKCNVSRENVSEWCIIHSDPDSKTH